MHISDARLQPPPDKVEGDYVARGPEGAESFYRIANYDLMDPFFMSVVSASNHWLFISSRGGLTAGRQNSSKALFPYYTEDKIHDSSAHTGSRTVLRVARDGKQFLWEPFLSRQGSCDSLYRVTRNLYKNVYGNKLTFEEINHDLELAFRYTWTTSDRFGFIKHSELSNTGAAPVAVDVLDGIENLLPWGVTDGFQNQYSCLGDAYKDNALEVETGLATYAFSSVPGDNPEPAEALRATVCWSSCSREAKRLLSSQQLDRFRRGGAVETEDRLCGRRGAYFVQKTRQLDPGAEQDWLIVADLEYGLCEVATLRKIVEDAPEAKRQALEDIEEGTHRLVAIVAKADGLQQTGDNLGSNHHFANVLFNIMRGGVFESSYSIPVADLAGFVRTFNHETGARHQAFLDALGERVELGKLLEEARALGDPDFLRLVSEYLPISFSRRHGDPSRPWNQFSINVKSRDGSKVLDYQGNWRDIFQNWEALCLSFPEYLEGIIGKFVNTTTADGYNPYRVTKEGYDWEAPDPHDPWAHFGYWGDHQLIYLLKFLESSRNHYPGALEQVLDEARFVYADVPYDIKPYAELLEDPRSSISYNLERERRITDRVEAIGLDGRYLTNPAGDICRANLIEKILVPLLAKVSNFVAGAGFWMNTQRPEWNDANNALAGYGASMVTLYYARRYVSFCIELVDSGARDQLPFNEEVAHWLERTFEVLESDRGMLDTDDIDDADRKRLLDGLGKVAGRYRAGLYANGMSGRSKQLPADDLLAFLRLALAFFDQTIRLNKRDDGLYHAYNVLELSPDGVSVERLNPMLEGQVSLLSSGAPSASEAVSVLEALRESEMYRADQHSYLLYPHHPLPRFLDKNTIPKAQESRSRLFAALLGDGNSDLVEKDVDGRLHFNGRFKNERNLRSALDRLGDRGYADLVKQESDLVAEIFESVFEHKKFTGRSGTFYGYEGLGCIYWHMVSKLLLAVQECCLAAAECGDKGFEELAKAYYEVRAGLGFNKPPNVYGAFPTDPYSHTPGFGGARQPGMTGQVKEEILTRLGELGLTVREGRVGFDPVLLRRSEFSSAPYAFEFYDVAGKQRRLELDAGTLVYTYCQVPIVYRLAADAELTLHLADGTSRGVKRLALDQGTSSEIFRRSGKIERIEALLSPGLE